MSFDRPEEGLNPAARSTVGAAGPRATNPDLESALEQHFGFTAFREGQREIVHAVVSGRDVVAVMPTGGGKSLCYQLPALMLPGVTLVVSPLIALMKDQVDALTERGIAARYINSSLSLAEQDEVMAQARAGEIDLLYVAPERFKSRKFLASLSQMNVSLFAVDEAHCLSQWGHDFRPDYLKLEVAVQHAGRPPVAAFTATATAEVREDIATHLGLRDPAVFFSGVDRPNLYLAVAHTADREAKFRLITTTARKWKAGSGIVYASTRKNVDRVWKHLAERGLKVVRYHAGLSDDERQGAQDRFMSGQVPLIVATNAFGMGVDKADIRFVIHFDFPGSLEAYYQEVGRAGRDGQPSECRLLFNYADLRVQEFFIDGSNPPRAIIEDVYHVLARADEDVIELTSRDITQRLSSSDNEMAVATAVKILDKYGALDRDRAAATAWVRSLEPASVVAERVARAPVQARVVGALNGMLGARLAAGADVDTQTLARKAALERDQLNRALSELHKAGLLEYVPPFRGRAIRVGRAGLSAVDWDHLADKDRRDRQRVRDVIDFAYGDLCRKAALRRYFGVPMGKRKGCGSCDICAGIKPPERSKRKELAPALGPPRDIVGEELDVVRKALACVARMKGRFGRGRVAQVLKGSRSQDLKRLGLDQLSTYGLLSSYRLKDLEQVLHALVASGLVKQRALDDGPVSGATVVDLSSTGWEVMAGRAPLRASIPPIGQELSSTDEPAVAIGGGGGAWQDDSPSGDALLDELKRWRRDRAAKDGVRSFYVLHDRVLKTLARYRPSTHTELMAVKGIGPSKVAAYGDELLELLTEFRRMSSD